MKKIYFETEEEKAEIITEAESRGWLLIETAKTINGDYLVFDTNTQDIIAGLIEDVNQVAEMTVLTAMDKDELAEMLVYALQRIDELEVMING